MELVALNDRQFRAPPLSDPELGRVFQGVYPCDRLPEHPPKSTRGLYIVNTDPAGEPGQHWLVVWTENGVYEVFGSTWCAAKRPCKPTTAWPCPHYAILYLQERVRRRNLLEFVEAFRDGDYLWHDHRAGKRVRT